MICLIVRPDKTYPRIWSAGGMDLCLHQTIKCVFYLNSLLSSDRGNVWDLIVFNYCDFLDCDIFKEVWWRKEFTNKMGSSVKYGSGIYFSLWLLLLITHHEFLLPHSMNLPCRLIYLLPISPIISGNPIYQFHIENYNEAYRSTELVCEARI